MERSARELPLAYHATRGATWIAVSATCQFGLGFIANILLTRLLFPSAFGEFALAVFFGQVLRVQSKIGVGHAFAQNRELTGDTFGTYAVTDAAASLAGVVLTCCMAPVLLYFGYSRMVVELSMAMSITYLLEGVAGIAGTILSRELRFKELSVLNMTLFPISYIPAFWLATHGGGAWSIVAQGLAFNILMAPVAWLTARSKLPYVWKMMWRFRADLCRKFLKFGATVGLGILAALLLTQLDNFLVGTFVGVTMLGLYDRAYRTAEWPGALFQRLISHSAFYMYSKLQDDRKSLERMVTMVIWSILFLTVPVGIAIFVVAPDLLLLLYGQQWVPAATFLRILIVYAVLKPLWENAGTFFIAMGKPKTTTSVNVIQTLVLLGAGVPLTMEFGALGTCAAVGLAFATGMTIFYKKFGQEIPIRLAKMLVPSLVAGLCTIFGYLAINRVARLDGFSIGLRIIFRASWIVFSFWVITFLAQPAMVVKRLQYVGKLLAGKEFPQDGAILD
jgi:PST family polysaccharide transporter